MVRGWCFVRCVRFSPEEEVDRGVNFDATPRFLCPPMPDVFVSVDRRKRGAKRRHRHRRRDRHRGLDKTHDTVTCIIIGMDKNIFARYKYSSYLLLLCGVAFEPQACIVLALRTTAGEGEVDGYDCVELWTSGSTAFWLRM